MPAALFPLLGLLFAGDALACPLCGNGPSSQLVQLTPADTQAAAEALARENHGRLARIDLLLHAGRLGPPESAEARRQAQQMARVWMLNLYRFLFQYAADPERVYEAGPAALEPVLRTYSESSLFPIAHLRRVRMGQGRVCVSYDLSGVHDSGHTTLGGREVDYRIQDRLIEGRERRLLTVGWPSKTVGSTEALLESHYTFEVRHLRSDRPSAAWEAFVVSDVRGGWLRRWGVHRPTAFVFWSSALDQVPDGPPRNPMVGVRIYIPGLRFELPLLLPDIDLEDLRPLELPLPFLEVSGFRKGQLPDWLEVDGPLSLQNWRGLGPVPAEIRDLFPNQ